MDAWRGNPGVAEVGGILGILAALCSVLDLSWGRGSNEVEMHPIELQMNMHHVIIEGQHFMCNMNLK